MICCGKHIHMHALLTQDSHIYTQQSVCLVSHLCTLIPITSQNKNTLMFKQLTCHISVGNDNLFDRSLEDEDVEVGT